MRTRLFSFLLVLVLCLGLCTPALAYDDKVYDKDTLINVFGVEYNNVVVKAGVTVTFKKFEPDPSAIFIHGSLTVEEGGCITGPGTIALLNGAPYSGIDLYYKVRGQEVLISSNEIYNGLVEDDPENRLIFWWNEATGHFALTGYGFEHDPFTDSPGPQPQANPEDLHSAQRLNRLGLFRGTNGEGEPVFELERLPKRTEAVVLLIRLLGKDGEAGAWPAEYTYGDIDGWAVSYISYAFAAGLTNGVGGGRFNSTEDTPEARATVSTPQQFLTFVLRALGYADESTGGTDFSWRSPETLAQELRLIRGDGDLTGFNRGICAHVMDQALLTPMKDGRPLWQKLMEEGVFTQPEFEAVYGRQG